MIHTRIKPVILTSLPKSWWSIYTEALLNSRGLETESQQWRRQMANCSAIVKAAEVAYFKAVRK